MRADRPGLKKQIELKNRIAVAQGYENHNDAVAKIAAAKATKEGKEVQVKCPNCDNVFPAKLRDYIIGVTCPYCRIADTGTKDPQFTLVKGE